MSDKKIDIAVIGAGIVGVSSALWLQRQGLKVVLIDRDQHGLGASSGNAGVFGDYSCSALNDPSLIKQLPQKIFAKNSPLALRFPYVMTMIPWFMQFLINCRAESAIKIASDIEYLCRYAKDGITPLLEDAKAFDLIKKLGVVELYKTSKNFAASAKKIETLTKKQYSTSIITPDDLRHIEGNVKLPFYKGVFYQDAWNIIDPALMVKRLADNFIKSGGKFTKLDIIKINKEPTGGVKIISENNHIFAKQAVIAAGAFSTRIKCGGVDRLPLEAERGYHVMFNKANDLIKRPISCIEHGVFISPIMNGIRAAGTVEFGGLSDKKSQKRIEFIEKSAKEILPNLADYKIDSSWLGYRPTMPDSLPVIGRSREMPDVILAFAHQHLGMTLGGITGKIIAEIATNKPSSLNISAYSPERFNI